MLGARLVVAQVPDVIPPSGLFVTDRAGLLTPSQERTLTERLRRFETRTTAQLVIVTLPDLGGADAALYATELGQQWGVGQADADNGIVILVSRDDQEVFIAVGLGLEEEISEAVAARIVSRIIVPNFRGGHFYVGLERAANVLMEAVDGASVVAEPESAPVPHQPDFLRRVRNFVAFLVRSLMEPPGSLVLLFVIIIIVIRLLRKWGLLPEHTREADNDSWDYDDDDSWDDDDSDSGGWSGGDFSGGGGSFGGGGAGGRW